MPIPDGTKAVDDVLTQANWDINQLIAAARDRILTMGTGAELPDGAVFGLNNCETWYGVNNQGIPNQELVTWCLGVLLIEHTAGLLAQKVEDGHCRKHRLKPDYKPCPDMAREHLRMLGSLKLAVKVLYDEIEALERNTKVAALPAAPKASGS